MTRFLMNALLLVLFASPALAQSFDPNIGSGNIMPGPDTIFVQPWHGYSNVQPMPGYVGNELAWPSPDAVFMECCVIGPYPKPNVRLQ